MRKRINFTGRKKIPQHSVSIRSDGNHPPSFSATWDANDWGISPNGRVYIEAYSSGQYSVMRFPWGTVQDPLAPKDTRLTEIPGDHIGFDFKVVDESEHIGRLIAVARNIRLRNGEDDTAGRQSILPVNAVDLGEQVWRLSFRHNRPWLEVNNRIPGIKELITGDEQFFALVYPQVVRQVLLQILIIDGDISDPDESVEDWRCHWLRWGRHWHPDKSSPAVFKGDRESQVDWIEEVVQSFCQRHLVSQKFCTAEVKES
jgi:hypothetical protein